jgi:hypothetical protein
MLFLWREEQRKDFTLDQTHACSSKLIFWGCFSERNITLLCQPFLQRAVRVKRPGTGIQTDAWAHVCFYIYLPSVGTSQVPPSRNFPTVEEWRALGHTLGVGTAAHSLVVVSTTYTRRQKLLGMCLRGSCASIVNDGERSWNSACRVCCARVRLALRKKNDALRLF